MPTYTYRCTECGEESEYVQKITEDPKTECEHCGVSGLKKIIKSSRFMLKGNNDGWDKRSHRTGKQRRFVKHGNK